MKRILLLMVAIACFSISSLGQSLTSDSLVVADSKPEMVTLYSRIKDKGSSEGYDNSTFSFWHGVRSDVGAEVTKNNYDLIYGNISLNGDRDWFGVTMVTDDCSRIKDLGEMTWADVLTVPILPASPAPHQGTRMPAKGESFEQSSNGQVTRVTVGHMYVVHTKDRHRDFYAMFRVEKLIKNNEVTISWKLVPSPEYSDLSR